MEYFDEVDDFVEGVIGIVLGTSESKRLKKKSLLLLSNVFLFHSNYVASHNSYIISTSLKKLFVFGFAFLVLTKIDVSIFIFYAYEIFDEIDWFKNGILFASKHQSYEIVFLFQLLVGFIFC